MHKVPILYSGEGRADTVLRRRLETQGYRVFPKVRLSDALATDYGDHLTEREFGYFAKAHLDFLVTRDNMPEFAVEFDGPTHSGDAVTIERDVIKNALCKRGELPLLRVAASEVEEDKQDKVSVLDYMLMRYVSWQKEYPAIMREIQEYAATIEPGRSADSIAIDLDPAFHFDLKHPFPGRDAVLERLWSKYRIAWSMWKPKRHAAASYLCNVGFGGGGPGENEQFYTCNRRAVVWRPGEKEEHAVFSQEVSASLRSWLPLRSHVPSPDMFHFTPDSIEGADVSAGLHEIVKQFEIRVESMWFPRLPGLSAWDITEHFAEYLGFRAVERWARRLREGDRQAAASPHRSAQH